MRMYFDKKEAQAITKSLKLLLEKCDKQEKLLVETLLFRIETCLELQGKSKAQKKH